MLKPLREYTCEEFLKTDFSDDELKQLLFYADGTNVLRTGPCSWTSGYISRKGGSPVEKYSGRYGIGFKVHYPSWRSTRYHSVEYFLINEYNMKQETA